MNKDLPGTKRLNVVVMLGGVSAEREVSLRSGRAVASVLRSVGYNVFELDPANKNWSLPQNTDVVFLALHGSYGEDGTIQEELERLGVPYTGCDPQASRICFDKIATKEICVKNGIPTARFLVVSTVVERLPDGWKPPLVIKPARQGSSVGLRIVNNESELKDALQYSLGFDNELIVEELIAGREVTVGILDGRALPVVEVRPKSGVYDYKNKYTPGATEYYCPADFDAVTTARIQKTALEIFKAVGARDYARVDIIVRDNGEPVVLEVNTLPGMTETSLLPKAAAADGISYAELCSKMVELALKRGKKKTATALQME